MGDVAQRAQWMDETLAAVRELRQSGVPVVGYTWFPLISMIDWAYRTGRKPLDEYLLHMGLYQSRFDMRGVLRRQPTRLVTHFQKHVAGSMPPVSKPTSN